MYAIIEDGKDSWFFVRMNPAKQMLDTINSLPLNSIVANTSTVDHENGHYIFIAYNLENIPALFTIAIESGEIINDPEITGLGDIPFFELQYDNKRNQLFGVIRNSGEDIFDFISIDQETANITIISTIDNVSSINIGSSTSMSAGDVELF